MPSSLYAFLHRLIDYAGLFPPANLALEPALRNYAAYQTGPDAWMLGRFICPAAQLADLDTALFTPAAPLALATLTPQTDTADEFLAALFSSLKAMAAFSVERGPVVSLPTIELPLPAGVSARADLRALLDSAARAFDASPLTLTPFFELPLGPDWQPALTGCLDLLADYNATRFHPAGFKLRTGGPTPAAFPAAEVIADALTLCRDRGVALKCTAGLHHPLRRYDESVQTKMHGFVNLFGAGILARVHALPAAQVQTILADEDPAHFAFTENHFTWQDLSADTAAIIAARTASLIAYGSCSFDEPRADLKALGWL
jgi:hypothetical protein